MKPFLVLGISETADDSDVRKAYLECVRRWPPERDPDRFREINDAYSKIKDERSRTDHLLFDRNTDLKRPFDVITESLKYRDFRKPPVFEKLKEHLKTCLTNH